MPVFNTQRRGTARTIFPDIAVSSECLNFAASFSRRHEHSRFESQRIFQAKLCSLIKAQCLLGNGPEFLHFDIFNRGGKLGSLSAIPVIV